MRKITVLSLVAAMVLTLTLQIQVVAAATTIWADSVSAFSQGLRKDSSPVLGSRSNPTAALGATDGSFVSLGFGGSLVVKFNQMVGGSLDVSVFEVTTGEYPVEAADVSVSTDGVTWTLLGTADNTAGGDSHVSTFSLSDTCIQYVKLVDVTDSAPLEATADAFDVDGISAEYTEQCATGHQGPIKVTTTNTDTTVVNEVVANSNTGGNEADGGQGGKGGSTGSAYVGGGHDNGATSGDGGQGGNGGSGGLITTGDAGSEVGVVNVVNSTVVRVSGSGCGCSGTTGKIKVRTINQGTAVVNVAGAGSNSGDNTTDGGKGGKGGKTGSAIVSHHADDNNTATSGNGGNGGTGGMGGAILTGTAWSSSMVSNTINSTLIRIRH